MNDKFMQTVKRQNELLVKMEAGKISKKERAELKSIRKALEAATGGNGESVAKTRITTMTLKEFREHSDKELEALAKSPDAQRAELLRKNIDSVKSAGVTDPEGTVGVEVLVEPTEDERLDAVEAKLDKILDRLDKNDPEEDDSEEDDDSEDDDSEDDSEDDSDEDEDDEEEEEDEDDDEDDEEEESEEEETAKKGKKKTKKKKTKKSKKVKEDWSGFTGDLSPVSKGNVSDYQMAKHRCHDEFNAADDFNAAKSQSEKAKNKSGRSVAPSKG